MEFAILAPSLLIILMGVMESCRLMWITQAANTVAYGAARCQAIGTNCANTAAVKNYVQTLGKRYIIQVDPSSITATTKTTCRGFSGSSKVQFTVRFASVMSQVAPLFPKTLTVSGCFLQL